MDHLSHTPIRRLRCYSEGAFNKNLAEGTCLIVRLRLKAFTQGLRPNHDARHGCRALGFRSVVLIHSRLDEFVHQLVGHDLQHLARGFGLVCK